VESLVRYPWLLPLAWLLKRGASCDPVVVARELGVSGRLARSLVYYGWRTGLCGSVIDACIVRSGRVFYGRVGSFTLYARLRKRRVLGMVFSPTGVYRGLKGKIFEEAVRILGEEC